MFLQNEVIIFYLCTSVLFLVLIFFLIVFYINFNKNQNNLILKNKIDSINYENKLLQLEIEKKNQIENFREQIANDIHDDLGATLSAIKLKAEFLRMQIENKEWQDDLEHIISMSKETNSTMRDMLWSLAVSKDTLHNFGLYLDNFLNDFFKNSGINVLTKLEIPTKEISIDGYKRHHLIMCIKEICNNTVKHSECNTFEINVSILDNIIYINTRDNGKGIENKLNKGNGLKIISNRIKIINGELKLATNKGTEFNIVAQI